MKRVRKNALKKITPVKPAHPWPLLFTVTLPNGKRPSRRPRVRLSAFHLRIDGMRYAVKFTREGQFLDGREFYALVDHDKGEIRLAAHVRAHLVDAISEARDTLTKREHGEAIG